MRTIFLCLILIPLNAWPVSPFQKYGDEFEALAKAAGIFTERYLIRFGNPPKSGSKSSMHIGFCEPQVTGHHVVTIDKDYWNSSSEECKRALIFHEAGHCALRKDHAETGIMKAMLDCKADVTGLFR